MNEPSVRGNRIDAIDAVRGGMMITIAWLHAMHNLEPGHAKVRAIASYAFTGTVGFTTMSGLMVGWFAVAKRTSFARVSRRYVVRSVRLVAIEHPIITLALLSSSTVSASLLATHTLYITDVLAVLFVILVPFTTRIGPHTRLALGIAALVARGVLQLWTPASPAVRVVHELLCGVDPSQPHVLFGTYSLLSVGGTFLVGTWLGSELASTSEGRARHELTSRLMRRAMGLVALSAALVVTWVVARHVLGATAGRVLYPDYEGALYPLYLGAACWLLAHALRARLDGPIARALVLVGRASLFAYVAQYYLVQTVPGLLGLHGTMTLGGWLALCAITGPLLVAAVHARRRMRSWWRRGTPVEVGPAVVSERASYRRDSVAA